MPIENNQNRFKSGSNYSHSSRNRFINDIRPTASRNFPGVGMTLSAYKSTTIATPTSRTLPAPVSPETAFRGTKKERRKIITKKRIALLLIVILLGVGAWVGAKFLYNASKVFHGNIFSALTTTKLKGEDTGRVNILLAGNSADDYGHDGGDLTDSIMILSIDTKDNTAFMLSVPRDLWVDIPGNGHAKINEAYVDGKAENFNPNGGMGLLEEVIQQNFGITIDYYALINYSAFRDAVNAVGGIDFNVQSSDPRGLYDPSIDYATHGPLVRLTNGVHHLDGEQALDLARARGDAYGAYGFPQADFDRTQHQREMLLALKTKTLTLGVLANPVTLNNLFDSIGKNVQTDFTLSEAHRLYDLTKSINNANIQSESLNSANGSNLLVNYSAPNGESALIPAAGLDNFGQIQLFVKRLTTDNPVLKENAAVAVLNGTNVYGLASKTAKTLTAKDVNVKTIGDAQAPSATTTIIDASGGKKPATLKLLESLYGTHVTTTNPYANTLTADFIVIVGNDQVSSPSTQ